MRSLSRFFAALVVLLLGPFVWSGEDFRFNTDLTAVGQGETSIAINPNDSQHIVALWIDWQGNRGQGVTIYNSRSLDGGVTWAGGHMAATLSPVIPRVDPAVTFDGLGNVFAVFATVDPLVSLWVLKSTDGGLTFAPGAVMEPLLSDKPWIAADPVNNIVHGVWVRVSGGLFHSRSTDQAATFSPPQLIAGFGLLPSVATGTAGDVYVSYFGGSNQLFVDRSLDQGVTWLATDLLMGTVTAPPAFGTNMFKNTFWPNIAVDNSGSIYNGRVYLVWSDGRNGDSDIYFSFSPNQGTTWFPQVRLNDDFIGGGTDQMLPWLWVDDAGHVHVMWIDRRDDPDNLGFAVYMATSMNGGQRFGPNIRVSDKGLAQGGLPLSPNQWLGDYNAAAGAGGKNYLLWSDGRNADTDLYMNILDDEDFDEDGILNDGSGDGAYGNVRCTGGATTGCDDNCPGTPNPTQAETDGDFVGDECDNCPSTLNPDQFDQDRDGLGDLCDPCPLAAHRPAGDPDGDTVAECTDNCPGVFNPGQTDADGDLLGDDCDPCPTPENDADGDGWCAAVDNCPTDWNPAQADQDSDGVGNVCDGCPSLSDPAQTDSDGDGQGDLCDCQSTDANDRAPGVVPQIRTFKTGNTISLGWTPPGFIGPGSSGDPGPGFDAYSITRGLLSDLHTGTLGSCLQEGVLFGTADPAVPPPNDGYFYLVQGQNYDCGLGPLGYDSQEAPRVNTDPGACTGHPVSDVFATSEATILGTVTGSLADTQVSDNTYETITEAISMGQSRFDHRWTFVTLPGIQVEFHLESAWTSTDNDVIQTQYSTDGGMNWIVLTNQTNTYTDQDRDFVLEAPAGTAGTVLFRLIDTSGGPDLDTFDVDKLWMRVIP